MLDRPLNDPGMPGYFLPEDSQFRLKKLRDHMEFLSHLAQPRTADEEREWVPEIRVGELAVCLELLAEQAGLVLEAVSFPMCRDDSKEACESGTEAGSTEEAAGAGSGRFLFGITLDQIDTLNRLIEVISAHGDVVTAARDAGPAEHTLPLPGHAILDGARAVRDLIRQVETQQLVHGCRPRTGVGEEPAVYGAVPADWAAGSTSATGLPSPADWSLQHAGRSRSLRLH